MSRLEYYNRPLVAFDASNKEHRKYFRDFLRHKTWGRCKVRFICPDDTGQDLVKMMTSQLVDYYVAREFKNTEK